MISKKTIAGWIIFLMTTLSALCQPGEAEDIYNFFVEKHGEKQGYMISQYTIWEVHKEFLVLKYMIDIEEREFEETRFEVIKDIVPWDVRYRTCLVEDEYNNVHIFQLSRKDIGVEIVLKRVFEYSMLPGREYDTYLYHSNRHREEYKHISGMSTKM